MKKVRPISTMAFIGALTFAVAALAQSNPPAPTPAPAQTQTQAPEPTPAPAAEATPAPSTASTQVAANEPARTCRTRKEAGEACACLSAPDEVGSAQAATDGGRNMCVVPQG